MSRTVLVADDDPDIRDIVAWCLRSEGYRVIAAEDGLQALRRLSEGAVDLLVLDLHMPSLDGMGVLANIRQGGCIARVPVVMITARPNDAPKEAVDAVVSKPFDLTEFVQVVRSLIGHTPDQAAACTQRSESSKHRRLKPLMPRRGLAVRVGEDGAEKKPSKGAHPRSFTVSDSTSTNAAPTRARAANPTSAD